MFIFDFCYNLSELSAIGGIRWLPIPISMCRLEAIVTLLT